MGSKKGSGDRKRKEGIIQKADNCRPRVLAISEKLARLSKIKDFKNSLRNLSQNNRFIVV